MAHAHHHVPQEDFSVAGTRVSFKDRYRGVDIVLTGTVLHIIWDRNYGCNFYRVLPDRLEMYGNLTHFEQSVRADRLVQA